VRTAEFDALPADEATALVRTWADVPAWAEALVAGRPYADRAALRAAAAEGASRWTDDQVEAALADHPRIGERHAGSGASAAHSAREQSGVDPADAEVAARLAEGNRRYEERFGRVYLVRAAGRSAAEMLAMLEERLGNDPGAELRVTAGQLAEIALLRLEATVEPDRAEQDGAS
jgi:2-oxo-4-hydroxy-4-carboxy-5-ureidoimidazoline decarboxylase